MSEAAKLPRSGLERFLGSISDVPELTIGGEVKDKKQAETTKTKKGGKE